MDGRPLLAAVEEVRDDEEAGKKNCNSGEEDMQREREWERERQKVGGGRDANSAVTSFVTQRLREAVRCIPVPRSVHATSLTLALVLGVLCALVSCAYYVALESCLHIVWEYVPTRLLLPFTQGQPHPLYHLYVPLVSTLLGFSVGVALALLPDEPGNLPLIVECLHEKGYVPTQHFLPMLLVSLLSITGGGSLGPEAPIVLMCAIVGGWVATKWLGQKGGRGVLRTATLCGMACGFAAFFGVFLGGALFALEVAHRMGLEYYESMTYAVVSATACDAAYHAVMGIKLGGIWKFPSDLGRQTVGHMFIGVALGVVGAALAILFIESTWLPNAAVCAGKLLAISLAEHGGFRGGFIFPFFLAGSAAGMALHALIPSLHPRSRPVVVAHDNVDVDNNNNGINDDNFFLACDALPLQGSRAGGLYRYRRRSVDVADIDRHGYRACALVVDVDDIGTREASSKREGAISAA
eukprot:jgi/Chlat1/2468/Chrsp175S00136